MRNNILSLLAKALATAALIGAVLGLAAFLFGARNPVHFSNVFFIAGGILIFIGLLSLMGGYRSRADFKTVYSQSAGDPNLNQRNQRWMADTLQSYSMLVYFVLTGGFLLAAGIFIG